MNHLRLQLHLSSVSRFVASLSTVANSNGNDNLLIRSFVDGGKYRQAIDHYRRMQQPDNYTFPLVIKACAKLADVQCGAAVHRDAAQIGLDSDVFICNSLISMYGKCGALDCATKLFDEMPNRNAVSWTAMIGTLAQNGLRKEATLLFHRMVENGIRPNRATFLTVMPCIATGQEANALYEMVIRDKFDSDVMILNAMVCMFSKCGRISFARKLFNGFVNKDLASWSSMIEAYARADMFPGALRLFKKMIKLHIVPDYVVILGIIRACSNSTLASLNNAKAIHGLIITSFFKDNLMVCTALIDLYAKRGSISSARRIFDRMSRRNLITWSTMISGYGIHGMGNEALELFDSMKYLMTPDHISFIAVLSACSHSGLIDEGWRCFNSMSKEFGLIPCSEHYACMVDLLGRSGQLKEAREFIEKMPIKPDSSVWGSLLGACRMHPDENIAQLAARSLFELDSNNSGRYILLSNVYNSLGKIEEAHKVRALMKERRARKTAGYTVIEVKNKLYKFLVGDQSNPQSKLIYKELDRLMERIREAGYVPNTNFALHDVEEETKEKFLYLHSEKLAIVFGLINTASGCTIRMYKNLRVCGDCHAATKFISLVTKRKIVVRDSRRFHHFSGGFCSCGDYW